MKLLFLSFFVSAFAYSQHTIDLNLEAKMNVVYAACSAATGSNNNAYKCFSSATKSLSVNPDATISEVIYLMCTAAADPSGGTTGFNCFKHATISLAEITNQEPMIVFILDTCLDVANSSHSGYQCFQSSYKKMSAID